MKTTTVEFCAVCKAEMIQTATEQQSPLPGPSVKTPPPSHAVADTPRVVRAAYLLQQPASRDSSVRVVITLTVGADGQSVRGHALTAADVAAPAAKMYRRTGDYMFEIKEGGVTKETGFLAGDPFEQRAYGTQTSHATAPSQTANLVIAIPGATKADLARRNIEINVYRLRGVAERISGDPVTFERVKSNLTLVGSVAVGDLREAFRKK
jgi:hypothetical protein